MLLTIIPILFFAYLLAMAANGEPRRPFNLSISSAQCRNFSALTQLYTCEHRPQLGGNAYAFNSRVVFAQDLQHDFEIRIVIDVQQKFAKLRARLVDLRLDGCHSLHAAFERAPLRYLAAEMRRTSNFPSSCPLKAGTLYKVNNFSVSAAMLPPYTPDLNYSFTLEYLKANFVFANVNVLGAIARK